MVDDWFSRAQETTAVSQALRAYLWWGISIRAALVAALVALLLVEGNFLAEWVLSLSITPSVDDVEEYTIVSYAVLVAFLVGGGYVRWRILQRLDWAAPDPARPPDPPSA